MTKALKATKPKLVATANKPIPIDRDIKIKQLHADLRALNVTPVVEAEVMAIALDLGGVGGKNLTGTDLAQLRDLAIVSMRINSITPQLDALFIEDPKIWAAVASKVQNDASLRRGCLRDLKATRNARGAVKDDADDVSQWSGVL